MKIKIKSKQVYDDHIEESEEIYNGTIEIIDGNVTIKHEKGKIVYSSLLCEANIIQNNNEIFISKNKENISNYETEYGKMVLKVIGKEIIFDDKSMKLNLFYSIIINDSIKYDNYVEISEA